MKTVHELLEFSLMKFSGINITVGSIVLVVAVYLMALILLKIIKRILKRLGNRTSIDEGRFDSFYQIIRYAIWCSFAVIVLSIIGVKLTFLIASSAALMVGIGLGLQNVFNDFISGIILLFEGSIERGDILSIGDMVGEVKKINIRTSHVVTRNNIVVIVPNHKLVEDNIINWSHLDVNPRFTLKVGVAYGSDTRKVRGLLLQIVNMERLIDAEPKPFVRFQDFGESSLDFELFFWSGEIFAIDDIKSDLRFAIDDAFRLNDISIPFPQRDLHIVSDKKTTYQPD
jgi:small-conductance mechanosensitive channel